ncbi:MAG: response regulator transcription factor [Hyphomicrobiaceae bacterium]|nr:response regulator transcription factor [Hyphomicrobiaceae bacterium]
MRLILVEDSQRLQDLLAESLTNAGYLLDAAASIAELYSMIDAVNYDMLIVDLGLPDGDGLTAIKTLRARGITTPILIITARGSIDDRVSGLDSGADDYLIKPFNHSELLARVRALLRRPSDLHGPILKRGSLEFDEAKGEVRSAGRVVELRLSERRLLGTLMRRGGSVVTKAAIEEGLSQFGKELSSNAVEALVSRVRKALAEAGSEVSIETVRGVGYRLVGDGQK